MANDDFNDYFDGPDIEEKPVEKPVEETQKLEKDADTIIVEKSLFRKIFFWLIVVCVAGIFIWGYLRYLSPYVSDAQKVGYVLSVEKKGLLFKTFEGEMLTELAVHDTKNPYRGNFTFSFDNDSLAQEVMNLQGSGKKVTLKYIQYDGVIPWRGASKYIITGLEK